MKTTHASSWRFQNNMHLSWTEIAIWMTQQKKKKKCSLKTNAFIGWHTNSGDSCLSLQSPERRFEYPLLQLKLNSNCRCIKVPQIRQLESLVFQKLGLSKSVVQSEITGVK